MQNYVSYNENLNSQRYTKVYGSYVSLLACMRFAGKTKLRCWIEAMVTSTSLKVTTYNKLYMYSFTSHENVIHLEVV